RLHRPDELERHLSGPRHWGPGPADGGIRAAVGVGRRGCPPHSRFGRWLRAGPQGRYDARGTSRAPGAEAGDGAGCRGPRRRPPARDLVAWQVTLPASWVTMHQARGRDRPQARLAALTRASVDSGAA